MVDGQTFLWTGANDNGQTVSSGLYWVKLAYKDSYGNTTVYAHEVVVLTLANQVRLRIFNSAGELVKTLLSTVYTTTNAQPTRLDPSSTTFAIGGDNGSTTPNKVSFDVGLGYPPIDWDGTNNQGQRVDSGTYTVQLESGTMGGGSTVIATTSVTVINAGDSVLAGAVVGPNPDTSADPVIWLRAPNAPAGTLLTARLYNVAGELIMESRNDLQPDRLSFDTGSRPVSGGVYVMSVTAVAPWGQVERHNFKLVVVR
jgi:hypothetical protein